MTTFDLARYRLHQQQIAGTALKKPGQVVAWLGAVQAQDYLAALWAIGLRMQKVSERAVEQAIADKTIVRTWFMRGTLHFVPGRDIHWLIQLMAPRMRKIVGNISNYQGLELDETILAKSNAVIAKALEGGKQRTRSELAIALRQAGIVSHGVRLSLMLQRAQADGLVCYGPRRGKQFAFALLDDWVPEARTMEREEALAEFAGRYFMSHGPATLQDFIWWSGLSSTDAKAGLEMVRSQLVQEAVDGHTYWFSQRTPALKEPQQTAYLLPDYDEYVVGYKDRRAVLDARHIEKISLWNSIVLNPTIVINGRVAGTWKRTLNKKAVGIEARPFSPLTKAEKRAVADAADRYGAFLDLPVVLV